jgi:hypothetical protein
MVLNTYIYPSITFLYGTIGLPIMFSDFSSGKIFLISFHRSSGMRIIVLTYFLLLVKYLTDNIAKQGAKFLSIFGIGFKKEYLVL